MSKSALARGVATLVVGASLASVGLAQTFRRLGACPKLGCIFPPDQYVVTLQDPRPLVGNICKER